MFLPQLRRASTASKAPRCALTSTPPSHTGRQVTIAQLESHLDAGSRVVRVMPNTPCTVNAAATGFAPGTACTPEDQAPGRGLGGQVEGWGRAPAYSRRFDVPACSCERTVLIPREGRGARCVAQKTMLAHAAAAECCCAMLLPAACCLLPAATACCLLPASRFCVSACQAGGSQAGEGFTAVTGGRQGRAGPEAP
jgi:hypothetical protein